MSGFRPRFFVPAESVTGASPDGLPTGTVVTLDDEDSHHVLRVLRLRPGDECEVVVEAAVHAATVLPAGDAKAKSVQVLLGERLEGLDAGAVYRHAVALVQGLPRPAVVDFAIEKSTEAGASLVLLVQTAGSPRPFGKDAGGRQARWARIAREAAKQSKQTAVPAVDYVVSPGAALERVNGLGLVSVVLEPGAERSLYEVVSGLRGDITGVALWIGPESGWTEAERDELLRAGTLEARLGHGVLRTETAGPVAVAVTRLALGDW